ncbi:hypothetical protein NKG05_20935 [Oerskovia sp. M15]
MTPTASAIAVRRSRPCPRRRPASGQATDEEREEGHPDRGDNDTEDPQLIPTWPMTTAVVPMSPAARRVPSPGDEAAQAERVGGAQAGRDQDEHRR